MKKYIFVTGGVVSGLGKVIIQSQNFGDFAGRVLNLLPKKYNG